MREIWRTIFFHIQKKEGRREGRKEGRREGREEGRKGGRKEERKEGRKGKIEIKEIPNICGFPIRF